MKPAMKATLLSVLVFPGAGHLAIGEKKKAVFFISTILINLILVVSEIMSRIKEKVTGINESGTVINKETIIQYAFADNIYLNVLLIIFMVTWLACLVDAYISGAKKE